MDSILSLVCDRSAEYYINKMLLVLSTLEEKNKKSLTRLCGLLGKGGKTYLSIILWYVQWYVWSYVWPLFFKLVLCCWIYVANDSVYIGKALQVEKMRNAGLIKGGSPENAIICRYMLHPYIHDSSFFLSSV